MRHPRTLSFLCDSRGRLPENGGVTSDYPNGDANGWTLETTVTRLLSWKAQIPTKQLLPKRLSEPSPHDLVIQSGPPKAPPERILTLEGVPITDIPQIPEAQEAERILFIIRDSLNFVSSYAKTFPMDLRSGGYLGPVLTETLRTYRQYLQEALGKTCNLGGLRSKCLFISYNRWLTESSYRREISMNLGAELEDADLGIVAPYGPVAPSSLPARGQGTFTLWSDGETI